MAGSQSPVGERPRPAGDVPLADWERPRGLVDRVMSAVLRGERPWATHALMAPASIWLFLFLIIPILFILALSFTERGPYGMLVWKFTLANYARALTPAYLPILLRSLTYAGLTAGLCLALGYPFAYTLAFFVRGQRAIWIILLMLPFWTSCLVAIYSWMILLGREGWVNHLLVDVLGVVGQPVQFLNTPFAVIGGLVYFYLPFMILPLYGSLEKIPPALLEASRDLGAGAWDTFWKVTFPLSLPGVYAGCLLTFIPCVGDFLTAEFMGGPGTYLLGNLIQQQFQMAQDWPFGASMATMLVAFLVSGLIVYQRLEGSDHGVERL